MAERHRITCVSRTLQHHIRRIGGQNSDGTRWWLTVEEAMAGIQSGRWQFYVTVHGVTADVTFGEDEEPGPLLTLPECPV